jgi:hypothetical protein
VKVDHSGHPATLMSSRTTSITSLPTFELTICIEYQNRPCKLLCLETQSLHYVSVDARSFTTGIHQSFKVVTVAIDLYEYQ